MNVSVLSVLASLAAAIPVGFASSAGAGDLPLYHQPASVADASEDECDVLVYGGTPAGVTSAIQAARQGKDVIFLSFNQHVGGLTSGGLTATDLGREESIGGMALEFYSRLGKNVDFSPSAAETLFREMLDEAGVEVRLGRGLQSVEMDGVRIDAVRLDTGETVRAKVFVDSTYEGDLLAAANVPYHVGREPSATYGETLAGQWQEVSWKNVYQFCGLALSPFQDPEDPASGLLPEIALARGKAGDGDHKLQAFNFRMYLSNGDGRVPFPKPPGYDPDRYALLARFLNADPGVTWTLNYTVKPMTDGPVQMRNGDSNNAGSFSSDYVGGNYEWADGTYDDRVFSKLPAPRRGLPVSFAELYKTRERIFQDHVSYQLGLLFFLANDPRVPERLKERVNRFGLDPREFQSTGFWPHQLYVREGRRMLSSYVMTQANCDSRRTAADSIGLASYPMDSHFCQRVVVERDGATTVRNEGGFGHPCPRPYPVSYRSIVPKKDECTNLLVPVCLSSSHVAFGSIRMEPVFMILGQSAGVAASMAIDASIPVQEVPYGELRKKLLGLKQRLAARSAVEADAEASKASKDG